jgi:hypothetical protein
LMGNAFLGVENRRVMPYVTVGGGYMQMHVTSDNGTFTTTTREPALNVGGGIFVFGNERIGLRGDVRYQRSFRNQKPSWTRGANVDIAPGAFDYWRASFGVVVRGAE